MPIDECHLCGRYGPVEKHHMLHGSGKRMLADKDKLTCWLCPECHRKLHDKGTGDLKLQKEAEQKWLRTTGGSIKKFIRRYGKNYLDEEEIDVQETEEGSDRDNDR